MADEIRDILAVCFQGEMLTDPRLKAVTITSVKLSGDLQVASVYYRCYLDADPKEAFQGLLRASGFLRHRLADNLSVRRVPELRFFHDESVDRGARIEALIDQINVRG
jgi:ribosome-binding factor A